MATVPTSPPKPQLAAPGLADSTAASQAQDTAGDDLVASLESQTMVLETLLSRVQKLKDAPLRVLATSLSQLKPDGVTALSALSLQTLGVDLSTHASNAFAELRAVETQLRDDKVQAALSLAKSHAPLGRPLKRKRSANEVASTPIRLAPARSEQAAAERDELPPEDPSRVRVTTTSLPAFIQAHNKAGATPKLHIWAAKASKGSTSSVVVRMSVADVLVAFVTFEDTGTELVVEAVSVFGPREKKPVYSQSDFAVFRKMSQHIVRLVRQAGEVSLQRTIILFQAYSEIFEAHCTSCKRVVSETDHIPAVEISFSPGNGRVFRHTTC
ncbi:hypothetical protein EXIGLDRAFT_766529 [Exidia glandulosa HHB12029]|uniref:Uncharacterized protein n=1 Tax=Exidia glandulosa HHB12029 TaxID=1314781 RepID=A0A165JPC2_EXIGL|nr:hypothetical protein EXIGLDRAFT_766529 [Exidia glandulosa HHB12029]